MKFVNTGNRERDSNRYSEETLCSAEIELLEFSLA